jgi:hypothetical protein
MKKKKRTTINETTKDHASLVLIYQISRKFFVMEISSSRKVLTRMKKEILLWLRENGSMESLTEFALLTVTRLEAWSHLPRERCMEAHSGWSSSQTEQGCLLSISTMARQLAFKEPIRMKSLRRESMVFHNWLSLPAGSSTSSKHRIWENSSSNQRK